MEPPRIEPTILAYLAEGLEAGVAELANTWKPEDPAYRADFYRQAMMNLSWSYFAFFHADAEHPDWAPLWNPVYTDQPNPDDIYLYTPIRGDLTYRLSGNRGSCALVTFNTQRGWVGLVERTEMGFGRDFDDRSLQTDADGNFELIFSARRPVGHTGNWAEIAPEATALVLRYRMVDWENERDPQLAIECLDPGPPKPRLAPEEILERIRKMSRLPLLYNQSFLAIQNRVKQALGTNVFLQEQYPGGGLSQQIYWPAVFEIADGEALILETEMPARRHYWNIQMNDPYFNAIEIVYRFSSINEATARFSADGKLRCVVANADPGVPNWLDAGGFHEGTIYGRWYDCDSAPLPTLKRVKLSEVRDHLPPETPLVTPVERAELLRRRVRAAQRRRRW
jgi:hypothetical protein